MTLNHMFLFIYMIATTLALVHAHRSGWPLDLWLNITSRSRRDRRDDGGPGLREPSHSAGTRNES